jgi:hypothetical protein
MAYKVIHTELQDRLKGVTRVAFDFETAPDGKYHRKDKAALNAHK